MSIGEVLVAILIMLLTTSVLVTTVSLGVRHYKESLRRSEANVLSSTLQSIMTNELAYTTEIHVSDPDIDESDVTEFQSQNYAIEDSLSTFFVSGDDYGKVMIGSKTGTALKLLGDGSGSYPNDIGVRIKKFMYNKKTFTFTIELSIGFESKEYLDQTFQVINVNNTEPTTGS